MVSSSYFWKVNIVVKALMEETNKNLNTNSLEEFVERIKRKGESNLVKT